MWNITNSTYTAIIKEGHLNDEFNPLVTFICMKDSKYIDLCKKNYILKRGDEEFNSHWIREIAKDDKYRKENPDKANHVFHELGDKIHMMYMDNFYKWETFKKELEDYLKRYNIDGYKENFPIVKQFWQAWIMSNKNIEEWRKENQSTYRYLLFIALGTSFSTRPNGHMRVCCTANASSSVGATNDKKHGGEVGVLKQADGKPANLNVTDLMSSWNNDYMKNVRKQMLKW